MDLQQKMFFTKFYNLSFSGSAPTLSVCSTTAAASDVPGFMLVYCAFGVGTGAAVDEIPFTAAVGFLLTAAGVGVGVSVGSAVCFGVPTLGDLIDLLANCPNLLVILLGVVLLLATVTLLL